METLDTIFGITNCINLNTKKVIAKNHLGRGEGGTGRDNNNCSVFQSFINNQSQSKINISTTVTTVNKKHKHLTANQSIIKSTQTQYILLVEQILWSKKPTLLI